MQLSKAVDLVLCHAEGEVGDVVVGGVEAPPGDTIWEQSRYIARDGKLHRFLLNEPRGGVFRHVNLLVPPKNPQAQAAFIIMEPADVPPMSGSNAMCVAKVVLETGIVAITEPETQLVLEAPGGLVHVSASCKNGHVDSIRIENLPSFAVELDRSLEVDGIGPLGVDIAFGGDSFVVVRTEQIGIPIEPQNARQLAELGVRITRAANEQIGFNHPEIKGMNHLSFCLFADPVTIEHGQMITRHAVAVRPGKIDRSPTGTGVSARMALLHAVGLMKLHDTLHARSILDSSFVGRIESEMQLAGRRAIRPSVSGRAYITGRTSLHCNSADPWPLGYRLNDTWPSL